AAHIGAGGPPSGDGTGVTLADAEAAGRGQAAVDRLRTAPLRADVRIRHRGDGLERARARKQEALARDAAELDELGDLRLVLDALGDRLEAECLAEHDDRARELRPVVLLGQAADE